MSWHNESGRHQMAAYGIKSKAKLTTEERRYLIKERGSGYTSIDESDFLKQKAKVEALEKRQEKYEDSLEKKKR